MEQKVAGRSCDRDRASPSIDQKTFSINPVANGYLFETGTDKEENEGAGPHFHLLCPRYSEPLTPLPQ